MRRTTWGFLAVFILLLAAPLIAQEAEPGPGGMPWGQLPWGGSSYTTEVDTLYEVIFWVTAGMLVLVEGLIVVFCIIYRRRPGHRPAYTHGNNAAEITWTVVPGLMLFTLAVVQIPYWHDIKDNFPDRKDPKVTNVDVLGQQFKWQLRYPGTKGDLETENDVWITSNLHMPAGNTTLIQLRSADVIHSYFIPHMRVKQDAVPGLRNRIWFKPTKYYLVDLKAPVITEGTGKDWKGEPRKIQPKVWIEIDDEDQDRHFVEGGKFYDKKIAVNPIESYMEFQGFYDVPKIKGVPKPVKWLYRGEIEEGKPWAECDYALGVLEVACAELCGYGHYTMRGLLIIEPPMVFENWLESFADFDDPLPPVWKYWKD